MPANELDGKLPSPWKDLLGEIDQSLKYGLAVHCIGGFALVFCYGLARTTGDIDYYTAIPAEERLEELAGYNSPLHRNTVFICIGYCHDPAGRLRGEAVGDGNRAIRAPETVRA